MEVVVVDFTVEDDGAVEVEDDEDDEGKDDDEDDDDDDEDDVDGAAEDFFGCSPCENLQSLPLLHFPNFLKS